VVASPADRKIQSSLEGDAARLAAKCALVHAFSSFGLRKCAEDAEIRALAPRRRIA
jgi:hypothetical protein